MADVRRAAEAADGVDPLDEAARMALAHSGLEHAALWVDGHDGFALLRGQGLDLAVRPEARGRGVGTALARAALAEAPSDVTAWSHVDDPAARAIAAQVGFAATRELWVMRRDGLARGGASRRRRDHPRATGPQTRPRSCASTRRRSPTIPSRASMDADNLADRMAEPWFDPAGLLVADAGDGLLGFHWTKQHSADLGEVYVVAVDPAAQGRGLGRALTAAGLAHLAALGVREILLYVESDNAPAIATYSRLGFAHTQTHVQYARLPGQPGGSP